MSNKSIYLWGVICILAGLVLLLGWFVIRILLAIMLIGIGLKILQKNSSDWFGNNKKATQIINSKKQSCAVFFSTKEYCFSDTISDAYATSSFQVIFGNCDILMPAGMSYRIKGSYGFSSIELPSGEHHKKTMGDFMHRNKDFDPDQNHLNIKLEVWFGKVRLKEESVN